MGCTIFIRMSGVLFLSYPGNFVPCIPLFLHCHLFDVPYFFLVRLLSSG